VRTDIARVAAIVSCMSLRRDERVFLVRMWLERQAPDHSWRGSVQEVGSGRKLYVTGPHDVADFIAVRLVERDAREE
jgi:hypothetical protein